MTSVSKFVGLSFLQISNFRIVIAQNSLPGCSAVTKASEEQREAASWAGVGPRAVPAEAWELCLETGKTSEQDAGTRSHGNCCFSLKLGRLT